MYNSLPNTDNNGLIEKRQPLVAALYARVSTGRQEQEATIESQIAEIKARIETDGNILSEENIFLDDGWSGELLVRPDLDKMRDAAKNGIFQVLYVYDRGRLSRVFYHQELIIDELRNKDIQFTSLHDINALTPEEQVLQSMQGVFHQYERVKIFERFRRGKLYKAKMGIMINGSSLYGWKYMPKNNSKPARYKIDENEAQVVRMICNWFGVERVSINGIIKKLFDLGIPPRKGRSQFWTKGPIVRILRCESYFTGVVYYNKSEAIVSKVTLKPTTYRKVKKNSRRARPREEWIPFKVPKILTDMNLYYKNQEILDFNKRFAPKNRKYEYLLTGKVYCGCGKPRAGDGYLNNHYYRCPERVYNFPLDKRDCKIPGVNAEALDNKFWKELEKFLTDPSLLSKQAKVWVELQKSNSENNRELESLEVIIVKDKEEESRYAKAYGTGDLEFEQFRELARATRHRRISHERQLKLLKEKANAKAVGAFNLADLVIEAKTVIASFDFAKKRELIRDIIDKIVIKERRMVEVWGHITLPALADKVAYEPIGRNSGPA